MLYHTVSISFALLAALMGGVAAVTLKQAVKPIHLVAFDGSRTPMQMMTSIDAVLQDVKKVAEQAEGYAAD